ncbi:MAG TPA: TonB-dependent receptor [Polyangiaceae bacterium]|nr:TonB-dependent receptor [Polyangiaceae bacterium]
MSPRVFRRLLARLSHAVLVASSCWTTLSHAEPEADVVAEVVVAGHKQTRPMREPTLAATRVDPSELSRPGANAAAVLSRVPGVQVSESGSAADLSTASVRGATSAQTPVYLAGIRLNDDLTGSADLSLVPLWMLGRAEVYRGNAPADADRLGIGGAIYFEPRLPRESQLRAGAQLGSFGQRAAWLGAQLARDGNAALLAFRAAGAQNDYPYVDNAGTSDPSDDQRRTRPNADVSERDAWAIGRTLLGKQGARLTTVFNAFAREQGVTGLAAVPALAARAKTARLLAGLNAELPCGSRPGCRLVLTSQAITTRVRLSDPDHELALLAPRLDTDGTRFVESARLWLTGGIFRALLGANLELEQLAQDGASALRAKRNSASARVALFASAGPHTEFSSLAVVTCDATDGPQQKSGCAELTPEFRLGVRRRFGAFELRSNFSRYARVPTLGELYGISALVRGSSALVPEQGLAWDLGTRWEAQAGPVWVYFDAFGFARHVTDLIAYRRSSVGAVQPYNVGSARVLGAEIEAGAALVRHARTSLALTLLDPRDTTAGRTLANDLVPHQSRIASSWYVEGFVEPRFWLLRRAGLDARLSHRGSRLADPAGLLVLPASTTLDLGATLGFGRAQELSLRAAVDDVFDARHFDFIGYPVPGRSFHASAEVIF